MTTPLRNRDVTVLVIAAAGSTGLTPVQLMKSVFLISKTGLSDLPSNFYPFFAYNYGPFHPDVYRDVEMLVSEGLVYEDRPAERSWSKYVITTTGTEYAHDLKRRISPEFSKYLDEVVAWVKSLTFNQLLRAIYAKYPEMRENSVFQEIK